MGETRARFVAVVWHEGAPAAAEGRPRRCVRRSLEDGCETSDAAWLARIAVGGRGVAMRGARRGSARENHGVRIFLRRRRHGKYTGQDIARVAADGWRPRDR